MMLEEWLIENLNQRYVIPEDFNAYNMLTRPTAKGMDLVDPGKTFIPYVSLM